MITFSRRGAGAQRNPFVLLISDVGCGTSRCREKKATAEAMAPGVAFTYCAGGEKCCLPEGAASYSTPLTASPSSSSDLIPAAK